MTQLQITITENMMLVERLYGDKVTAYEKALSHSLYDFIKNIMKAIPASIDQANAEFYQAEFSENVSDVEAMNARIKGAFQPGAQK